VKAFVTGATGFVGANVVRALLERGYDVRVLARPRSDRAAIDGLPVDVAIGDLLDPRALRAAMQGCGVVFHVAALYSFWGASRRATYLANVDGTRHVLQAAWDVGAERVVHTSSVAALGLRADGSSADESVGADLRRVVGDYKRSKLLGQEVALEFSRRGLPVVIVNPSFPVGPYDTKPTPTGQVIVDFLNRRMPAYVRTGMNVVAVEDVAAGHVLACEKGNVGELYILGGENVSMKQLLEMLAEISGLPAPRICLPSMPLLALSHAAVAASGVTGRAPRMTPDTIRMSRHPMYYNSSKAVRDLGLPQTPAAEALRRAVAWFRASGRAPERARTGSARQD
jgi:dihydroflavonol-4-reductase